jgi:phage baseplate assembly protein W
MPTDPQLRTDLRLALHVHRLRPVYTVDARRDTVGTRNGPRPRADLATVSGRDNLGQAIVVRLLTPRGELAALGHPEYGSRLHELIGDLNTETRRNLARLYILEALAAEPRVEQVVRVTVEPVPEQRSRVDVLLEVKPVGAAPLTVGPFSLEL